eukprot:m.184361 g.184361  ORF g.184361 m.184361 type:complete len:72 (+) comp15011_c0_seq3:943-1158(+)
MLRNARVRFLACMYVVTHLSSTVFQHTALARHSTAARSQGPVIVQCMWYVFCFQTNLGASHAVAAFLSLSH